MNMIAIQPPVDRWPVQGPRVLRDVPETRRAVLNLFKTAQRRGYITADRNRPEDDSFVAWIGPPKAPIAFAIFYETTRSRVWLDVLYVEPEHRRRGCGKRLLCEVTNLCARRGARRLLFGTTFENDAMRGLGLDCGFREESINVGKDLQVAR